MATISEVAKLAGVSVSTVSRIINNKPHVSPSKAALVAEAMKKLGISLCKQHDKCGGLDHKPLR